MTSSMPTSAATARAVRSLSPVSSTGAQAEPLELGHRLCARRLDRVGDDEDRARLAVPGRGDAVLPLPAQRRRSEVVADG